jgi:cellulose synthase/poly-beta-1,6-N-acetylglucosamine synthase-like glycosyltransferase
MHYIGVVDGLVICAYLILLPFAGYLLAVSIAALMTRKTNHLDGDHHAGQIIPRQRFLVAIPAHNEETGIDRTVRSCLAVNYPSGLFQVLVVADNSSDKTAFLAREAGARVIERVEPMNKTKGHAIAYLIDRLSRQGELETLDALVIVDADSTVDPLLLTRFAERLERGDDWIQCYDTVANAAESWRTQLMAYGFCLINGVLLAGQSAMGLSAGLRGNGMCLSTRGLRRVPWTTFGLAEDLEYSWSVRIAGGRIAYVDDVAVHATMLGDGGEPAIAQRLRWEYGRRVLKRQMIGPLLSSPRLTWPEKFAAMIELAMPTMSFLFCWYLLLTFILVITARDLHSSSNRLLFYYSIGFCYAVSTLGLLLHAASPFLLGLMPVKFASSLLYVPYYVVWKASIWFRGRPTTWSRTEREIPPPPRVAARNQTGNAKHGANC